MYSLDLYPGIHRAYAYLSSFLFMLGKELWKKIATELGTPSEHLDHYDRQDDPIEKIISDELCRRLTVGQFYDVLVKCGAGSLADKYL
jgi:hypothetical protein